MLLEQLSYINEVLGNTTSHAYSGTESKDEHHATTIYHSKELSILGILQ